MTNDHETESNRVAWQKGYDIGLAHEGEVPPLLKLKAMRNVLTGTVRRVSKAPPVAKNMRPGFHSKRLRPQGKGGDGPLLDLGKFTVRRTMDLAKKRGYVTYNELDQVLPPEGFTEEQFDDLLAQLSQAGINVVEAEEDSQNQRTEGPTQSGPEEEPKGGPLIPLVLQIMNDQNLSVGEKQAFALGLLRGLADKNEGPKG